jgi:hypothetical protein
MICGEEATGDRLARDAGAAQGCMWDLSKFHGKVPFPHSQIVSRDPDRRTNQIGQLLPHKTDRCVQWRQSNRSHSSQLLVHRELGLARVSRPPLPYTYLHSGSDPFPLSLVRTIVVSTRITDPNYNRLSMAPIFTAGPYAVETSYCTYQRRSSIGDHVHPLLQLANY